MEPDDPFGWITEICRGSSSEDSRLRNPSYFGQPDSDDSDSDSESQKRLDIPVASTGITMFSLPESPEVDTDTLPEDDEIFHTPPESRSTSTSFNNCNDDQIVDSGPYHKGNAVAVYARADGGDSRKAVDLGFSEVDVGGDSTQRIEVDSSPIDALRRKYEAIRVSKRGFSPEGQSSSKKLKSLDFESPIVRLGTQDERKSKEILKSLEKWKLEMDSLSPGATSEFKLENQQNHESKVEVGEGSVRDTRLDISTQDIDSEHGERRTECENKNGDGNDEDKSLDPWTKDTECDLEERVRLSEIGNDNNGQNSGRNKKTIEDADQLRCSGENGSNSREMEEKTESKRELPSWAAWRVGADERVEINERQSVQANMDSNNLSKHSSNLPETREKIEGKRALPSWANVSMEADRRVEVNETESDRVEVNAMEPERVEVNKSVSAQADAVSGSLREDLDDNMLLNVLTELKDEHNYEEDRDLVCMSLWEVAKRHGIEDIDSSA